MVFAGTSPLLVVAAVVVWIASLWLSAPPPPTALPVSREGVQLTPAGDARYRELSERLPAISSTMGTALSEAEIRRTIGVVRQLSDDVKAGYG